MNGNPCDDVQSKVIHFYLAPVITLKNTVGR